MSDLKKTTLGKITTSIFDGKHGDCENQVGSGCYFISVKDLRAYDIDYSNAREITPSDFQHNYKRTNLENGDTIYANTGDTIGKSLYVKNNPFAHKSSFQKSVAILKPKTDCVEPRYLYYLMKYETPRLRQAATGSSQKNLLLSTMRNFETSIHDRKTQGKIVNILGCIDDKVCGNNRINDNLAATAATLFQKMFLTPPDKVSWPVGNFSHFIRSTVGGDWGKETPTGNYIQKVSCIRGTDIPSLNAGSISSAPTRYILPKNFLVKKIKANDFVVEISGGSPVQATGRIAIVPQQVLDYRGDKLICSNFCRVVTGDNTYLQYFLQYWLYLYRAGRMFDYENSSTGLKNFDFSSFVEKEPIPIPPEQLVQSYNKAVSPLYRQLFANGFEIEALQEIQQHILPQIMLHGFLSC